MKSTTKRRKCYGFKYSITPEYLLRYAEQSNITGHLHLSRKRFLALFGFDPELLTRVWNAIRSRVVRANRSLRDYLATFYFLKCYCRNLAQLSPVFGCHENSVLGRVHFIARQVEKTMAEREVRSFGCLLLYGLNLWHEQAIRWDDRKRDWPY